MNLMFGEIDPREFDSGFDEHGIIINLSTLKEGYMKLNSLFPPRELGYSDDRNFDIAYANYIINTDAAFCEFFYLIYSLYTGKDVYIMSADEDWAENITESLLKLIQQRYGINAILVNTEEDYMYAQMNCTASFNSGPSLYNLDMDKDRFTGIMMNTMQVYGSLPWFLDGFQLNNEDS